MKSNKTNISARMSGLALLLSVACCVPVVFADRPGWEKKQVDWHVSGGSRIKAIIYPEHQEPKTFDHERLQQTGRPKKKVVSPEASSRLAAAQEQVVGPVFANVIDSPPIDGFVPWIVVSITDARSEEFDFLAEPTPNISGGFPGGSPETDYAIGIFDTGASAHVMGNFNAERAGLFAGYPDLVTSHISTIFGVTGSVDALVSEPLGLFIDGLAAIEGSGLLTDRSKMVGEENVAIMVGQGGLPDLPTAVGTPLSVYFTAVFNNERYITINRDNNDFTSPDITFYENDDPCIPAYPNIVPLELRPLGGINVAYITPFDPFDPEFASPATPSIINGTFPTQSIFFVSSVDLYQGNKSAIDKDRFMLDTGAQISVIGSRIAARLALNPANPDFEVEIMGVTGDVNTFPGFYVDKIEIPALGDWLSFTNVPVVLLDVFSPEGGTADGIIGMNLFVDMNIVLRGGGLFLQDDPKLEYIFIQSLVGDIAPAQRDGVVDWLDLAALADAWLADPMMPNWNSRADIVGDAIINFRDFARLAESWRQTTAP